MDAVTLAETIQIEKSSDSTLETSTSGSSVETKFQKAISAWRDVALADLLARLDTTASEIIEHQKVAVLERKEVAQRTKDFRKLDDAGKIAEYKTLLKAYQGFVDLLTTHNKESSVAFLQLYTSLSEVPDPCPLLEASAEALAVSGDVVPRLNAENEELRKRISRLSHELETTETRLRTETEARKASEKGSNQQAEEIGQTWTATLQDKEKDWARRESAYLEKIEAQEKMFKEMKAGYEVAQRLGTEEQEMASQKAAAAELQMALSDLDRLRRRHGDVEARNEQYKLELAQARAQARQAEEENDQTASLQAENSSLLRRLETLKLEKNGQDRKTQDHIKQLDRQKLAAQNESQDLRKRLQQYADYTEIKRELQMLKSVELAAPLPDIEHDEGDEDYRTNGTPRPGPKESLEQLILSKNKKLSNDLTELRVAHKRLVEQVDGLKADLHQSQTDLEKSRRLTASLETELERLQEEAANGIRSGAMSVSGTYTSRHPGSRRGRASPTSSIISGFDGPGRLDTLREPMGGGSGILPMVQAQRDRFKQKMQQLEEELQKSYTTVSSLRQEVASLQKDNLNLYEKSRYAAGYSRTGASTSAYGQHSSSSDTVSNAGEYELGDTWKSKYEAQVSPFFARLRSREATRVYRTMALPERLVYSLTRVITSTRTSRNVFAAYCLGLHAVLLVAIYYLSMATTSIGPVALSSAKKL